MRILILVLASIIFTGCASMKLQDYQDADIQFNPEIFFNNNLIAEGLVRDRSGKITRTFSATITAQWDDQGGTLDEVFLWSDGEKQTRVWQFTKQDEGGYLGTAGDVKGQATMDYAGNAINMVYMLNVPLSNGKSIAINMDDWLFQTSDNTLVNVTEMTKFGFRVGEVVLTMRVID